MFLNFVQFENWVTYFVYQPFPALLLHSSWSFLNPHFIIPSSEPGNAAMTTKVLPECLLVKLTSLILPSTPNLQICTFFPPYRVLLTTLCEVILLGLNKHDNILYVKLYLVTLVTLLQIWNTTPSNGIYNIVNVLKKTWRRTQRQRPINLKFVNY